MGTELYFLTTLTISTVGSVERPSHIIIAFFLSLAYFSSPLIALCRTYAIVWYTFLEGIPITISALLIVFSSSSKFSYTLRSSGSIHHHLDTSIGSDVGTILIVDAEISSIKALKPPTEYRPCGVTTKRPCTPRFCLENASYI